MKTNDDRRSFLKKIAVSGVGVSLMPTAFAHAVNPSATSGSKGVLTGAGTSGEDIDSWLETSLNRVFPQSPSKSKQPFTLLAARNSKISFQVCYRNNTANTTDIKCEIKGGDVFSPLKRLVGLVPMPGFSPTTPIDELDGVGMLPGLVPDPLMPVTDVWASSFQSRSFWITLNVPEKIKPGEYQLNVTIKWEHIDSEKDKGKKGEILLPLTVKVAKLVVRPRENFHVIHWWRGEATWNYYKTDMFDERWWKLTKAQLMDMLEHGSDVVYVPVLFDIKPVFKRPCQLLIIDEPSPGNYVFDWSRVKQFMTMCKEIGFKKFEWSHLWVYWGVKNPVRVYKNVNGEFVMLWPPDISGFSDTFINFLKQFLPQFHKFLLEEGVLKDSYFHLSDEPGDADLDNYRKAQKILNDLAPWMHPIMDALSNVEYGKQGLVDIPIPLLPEAKAYKEAKIPHWVYFCTVPRGNYLNRFLDTPLAKLRMAGWLFYHLKAYGFLHWGYNYWNKLESEEVLDPFHRADAGDYPGIPYGDPFVVYPGPDGPLSSIRWEVFAESLQDYSILQSAGIDPDDSIFAELKSYADYPKNEDWIKKTLKDILR